MPLGFADREEARHWPVFYERLVRGGRVSCVDLGGAPCWVAAERMEHAGVLWGSAAAQRSGGLTVMRRWGPAIAGDFVSLRSAGKAKAGIPRLRLGMTTETMKVESGEPQSTLTREAAMAALLQGWLQVLGPVTSAALGTMLRLPPAMIFAAMLAGEMQGLVMRGVFEMPAPDADDGDAR